MITKQSILQAVSAVTKSQRGVASAQFPNPVRDWFIVSTVFFVAILTGFVVLLVQYATGDLSRSVSVQVVEPTVVTYSDEDAADLFAYFATKENNYQAITLGVSAASSATNSAEEVEGE